VDYSILRSSEWLNEANVNDRELCNPMKTGAVKKRSPKNVRGVHPIYPRVFMGYATQLLTRMLWSS